MLKYLFPLLVAATAANAECIPVDQADQLLQQKYEEKPWAYGPLVNPEGYFLVIYKGATTYTVLAVSADGMACPMAAGQGLTLAPAGTPGVAE